MLHIHWKHLPCTPSLGSRGLDEPTAEGQAHWRPPADPAVGQALPPAPGLTGPPQGPILKGWSSWRGQGLPHPWKKQLRLCLSSVLGSEAGWAWQGIGEGAPWRVSCVKGWAPSASGGWARGLAAPLEEGNSGNRGVSSSQAGETLCSAALRKSLWHQPEHKLLHMLGMC